MKINKLVTVSALALAGLALIQTTASAQKTTASVGDLILGFDISDGVGIGATQDYEVDLGAFTTYNQAGYSNANITVFSAADLNGAYGAGALGRTDLEYSIVGTSGPSGAGGIAANALYWGSPSNAITPKATNGQSTGAGDISSYTLGLSGANQTANSNEATLDYTTSSPTGYTASFNNSNGAPFGAGGTGVIPVESVTSTAGQTQITTDELYKLPNVRNGTAIDVGTFTLNGTTGILSFQSAIPVAVPEPSTYALFGVSALALVLMRRRTIKA